MNWLYYYFLLLMIYSVIGYICEVIYVFIVSKKLVNRGFMFGPYVPIYGMGALLITFFLSKYYNDPLIVFFMGIIICSTLEYFFSYLMEKLFNNRWWDYSNYKFNLNGRVCLLNSILFGIGGLAAIYIINPYLMHFLDSINVFHQRITAIILAIIFLTDLSISMLDAFRVNHKYTKFGAIIYDFFNKKNIELKHIKERLPKAFPYLIKNEKGLQRLIALRNEYMKDLKHRKKKKILKQKNLH